MDVLFLISSVFAVGGSVLVVSQRNAIYALLGLLVCFAATAGVFLSLDAAFVAVGQILVYAGALAVLFLFVLMFTDTRTTADKGLPEAVGSRAVYDPAAGGRKTTEAEPVKAFALPSPLAVAIALGALALLAYAVLSLPERYGDFGALPEGQEEFFGSAQGISGAIFGKFPLAFEVVSLLIFAAVLGAVLLARKHLGGWLPEAEPASKVGATEGEHPPGE